MYPIRSIVSLILIIAVLAALVVLAFRDFNNLLNPAIMLVVAALAWVINDRMPPVIPRVPNSGN